MMEGMDRQTGSRFANTREIMDSTQKVNITDEKCEYGGIPILIDGTTWYVLGKDENTLIIAEPGSGKTRRVAVELIFSAAAAEHSMVITDCKGELYRFSKNLLEKRGYSIKVLNFANPECGEDRWNPLEYGAKLYNEGHPDKAMESFMDFAETLYAKIHSEKDMFWETQSANLLVAIILLLCKECKPEEVTLSLAYKTYIQGMKKIGVSTYFKEYLELKKDGLLEEAFAGILSSPNDTLNSIISVFVSVLSKLVINKDINDLMSRSTIDVDEFINHKTAIFIISKDESSVYNPIISTFIHQLYVRLIDNARKKAGTLPRPVDFVLDEFSNFTKINDFSNKISACRSRNIRMHIFVQSLNQLEIVYGKMALTIMGCCNNWIFFHSPEPNMLKLISERCGIYSSEYTHENQYLMSLSKLQHLSKEDGEALVLIGRNYPFVTMLPDKSVFDELLGIEELKQFDLYRRERLSDSDFSLIKLVDKLRKKQYNNFKKINENSKNDLTETLQLKSDKYSKNNIDTKLNPVDSLVSRNKNLSAVLRRTEGEIYRISCDENHNIKKTNHIVIIYPEKYADVLSKKKNNTDIKIISNEQLKLLAQADKAAMLSYNTVNDAKKAMNELQKIGIDAFYCRSYGDKKREKESLLFMDGVAIGWDESRINKGFISKQITIFNVLSGCQKSITSKKIMEMLMKRQLSVIMVSKEESQKIQEALNQEDIETYQIVNIGN